ncbi:hypothetical protein DYB37_013970 [Aphanomyces astaci]|uniref:Uncharacterized protein n=1 Tax=Aphanomyces astaci TaxID=112090 RepID=A0A397F6E9_APHAT|nr:hypothetical protein DYB25_014057 [Aphanomyces astaci]RHY88690.1 hypothetical protein DYB35_008453 [Aphanomyces astaci]RHZ07145.1 hypothetical protein DYB37_013970 [Aphanomyces astaci]RHZ12056.1 hypothetical protein DYB31_002887 [Aphanomyces astaci]RLO07746.1 hypothetical protein DYB28_000368 [Aphanomyces astaci]
MLESHRKRPCPEWTSTDTNKAAKTAYSYNGPTSSRRTPNQLQTAYLCILQLQARTLDRFRANGDWETARHLLMTTEKTRHIIARERRRAVLASEWVQPDVAWSTQSPSTSRKRVSFSDRVDVHEALAMDRVNHWDDQQPHPEELLMVRAMGLQAMPRANFSELW